MILLKLFLVFLKTGLCAIGGAYSFIPLLEAEIVYKYQWLTREEFLDILGVVRIFPGAISIKFATYTGYKLAGIPGVIISNIGNMIGPLALVLIATKFYLRFREVARVEGAFNMIQLVVFAMILAVALQLVNVDQLVHLKSLSIVVLSFLLFYFTKTHPIFIIFGAGIIGAFVKI
jgi:chromate transporter